MLNRALLRAAALLACGTSHLAYAQEAAEQAEAGADAEASSPEQAIVVTGSRLRGVAPVGSTVTSLGRNEIEASAAPTIDRLVKELPQVFDLGVSEASRAQGGGAGNIVYGNTVNIRGIGPYATLIIVDGHRVISNSRSIDPSVIPSLGVERVEVLADGGSAIYGSDAIAGVVNIVPRRSLDGVEAIARFGIAERGDFRQWQAGFAAGTTWDGGQAMIAYEHVYRSSLSGDDRNFFTSDQRPFGGPDRRITRCNPGNVYVGQTSYALPGDRAATPGSLVAGTRNLCEEFPGQDLLPSQEYDSVNGTFTAELGERITLFADAFFSNRDFARVPGPTTLNRQQVPSTNAFFVAPSGVTLPLCTAAAGAPAGTRCLSLDYSFYGVIPNDRSTGSARSWQVTPGIRVKLGGDWQFEGIYGYGRNNDRADSTLGINAAAVAAALRSSDPATALDVFGGNRTSAATLAAISNFVSISPANNRFQGFEARLNGSLVELPGGAAKLAAGYEGQRQFVALGGTRGVVGTPVVFRQWTRNVDSAYAELLVPLFGSGNAVPGLESLILNAAVRHDRYSDVGETTNPKFGANWSPVRGLTFRGNWGTSFRAPLISQIYGNSNNLFVQSRQDPTAGGASVQGVALSGENRGLSPETSRTWTLGADWDIAPDARVSLTYFDVDYRNQVNTFLSEATILSQEADLAGTGIVLRGQAAADRVCTLVSQGVTLSSGSFPGGSCSTVTVFVDGRNFNLGRSITRGFDFAGFYRLRTEAAGTFTLNLSGSYLTAYKLSVAPSAVLRDRLNLIFNPLRFKARASLQWSKDALQARISATYLGGYTNNVTVPAQELPSYTLTDLSLNWTPQDEAIYGARLEFGIEVRNLFDVMPPYLNLAPNQNGSGGYDATTTNPIGREFAFVTRLRF